MPLSTIKILNQDFMRSFSSHDSKRSNAKLLKIGVLSVKGTHNTSLPKQIRLLEGRGAPCTRTVRTQFSKTWERRIR